MKLHLRIAVVLALASCFFAGLAMCSEPNIVLIIGDDISVDDFGCYGHPRIRTPNVDKLAANGLRFTNAYLTTSQCSPTRCSVVTGRYPHNTGAPELHTALPGRLHVKSLCKQDLLQVGVVPAGGETLVLHADLERLVCSSAGSAPYGGGC